MFKKIIIEIDEKRENIEDFIANNILARWSSYKKADDLRYVANMAIINCVIAYANSQGIPADTIPVATREKIAKSAVKVEKKLNALLQKQLLKKSKVYKDRHNV